MCEKLDKTVRGFHLSVKSPHSVTGQAQKNKIINLQGFGTHFSIFFAA